ncbi:MAG: hypothetical protein AAF871_01270 [Pseudomonadota bacterium]
MTISTLDGRIERLENTAGHSATRRALSILRAKLNARAKERRHRETYRRMLDFDEAILRDIGTNREEVRWVASLPVSIDSEAAIAKERAQRATDA